MDSAPVESQPLISVITPTHLAGEPYLAETFKSLQAQTHQNWEWLLQFDGGDWTAPDYVLSDPRVMPDMNGRPLGVAITRNFALARANGQLVQILDADDQLVPNALEKLSSVLIGNQDLAYCAARTLHLEGDGRLRPKDAPTDSHGRPRLPKPADGLLSQGAIADYRLTYGQMPFALAGMMYRQDILTAFGGQMALDVAEDSGTLLALSEFFPGWFLSDFYNLVYRHHPDSTMHQPDYFQRSRPRADRIVRNRVAAIRALKDGRHSLFR